jgi:hypothetical protein
VAEKFASEKVAYSPNEAAAAGIGRTFLFEQIRLGKLPAKKAGRRTLIDSDSLRRWIKSLPRAGGSGSITLRDEGSK